MDLLEERQGLTSDQLQTRTQLKSTLRDIIGNEELLWQARAKQHWLKEGDGNTKFFHAMANGRARANHIRLIEDDGIRLEREQDMWDYFYSKFKKRFDSVCSPPATRGDWSDVFSDRMFLGSSNLTQQFTVDEIKKAVFQLGGDKAPGPDGFSMLFFQNFWYAIQADLISIFEDLYEGNLNTGPIDYAHICLVPKKEGAKAANDFRAICLINCVQKIISKVLANRLEGRCTRLFHLRRLPF